MKQYLSSIISYGIATTGLLLMFNSAKAQSNSLFNEDTNTNADFTPNQIQTTIPKRLNITVKIAEPSDLKIKEEDFVNQGQIIADRTREKERLTSQYRQLKLSLEKLENSIITAPLPPRNVPTISVLPPISYLEHEANVESKKTAITAVEFEIDIKKSEINYLSQLENIDSNILDHENAKLAQLQLKHTETVREYQLATAKLQTAKEKRAIDEHQNQVQQTNRIEQINQANLNYQRQLAEYEQRLTDKEFNLTQLKTKINEVENQIASIATVKSPYSGTVRRIQWLGQSPDGSLTAEITLMVTND
jgi:biotin carboxyl carrier protein